MSFHVYFDKQVHKKLVKKKASKKKIKSLNFAETHTEKQTCAAALSGSFETYNLFFFSFMKH